MSLQGSELEADDPITSYMLQVTSDNNLLGRYSKFTCLHLPYMFIGMGSALQVSRPRIPPIHECGDASFASVSST